jgi:hypothetical protein
LNRYDLGVAGILAGIFLSVVTHAGVVPGTPPQVVQRIQSLAADAEEIVSRTKPAAWQNMHSCLYYAFAGQYLLANRGIAARLVVGTVLYNPFTPYHHGIRPHAWLETDTYLVDFSTLPRWGYISIIPLSAVARRVSEIKPWTTRVLTLIGKRDPEVDRYLATHRQRFKRALQVIRAERATAATARAVSTDPSGTVGER